MRILLIVTDLYDQVGGGQTVYRKIIETSKNVEFFYFRRNETENTARPENVTALLLDERCRIRICAPPPSSEGANVAMQMADQIARSVAGMSFDIVDIPDFHTFGCVLRDAFYKNNVAVGCIVLAMHGNLSTSMRMQWRPSVDTSLERTVLEEEQFVKADYAYALSPRYIKEWQSRFDRPVHFVDPLCFIEPAPYENVSKNGKRPSLYCVGRREALKGNDLFVELVRWIRPQLYGKAAHIGSSVLTDDGTSSDDILRKVALMRDVEVHFLGQKTPKELKKLYRERAIIILPVRYDTLNLVALEALFSGCPVAVSSEAGVCDYLDAYYPSLPYIKIDFGDFYASVSEIEKVCQNYNAYRAELARRLKEVSCRRTALDMEGLYRQALASPSQGRFSDEWFRPIAYIGSSDMVASLQGLTRRSFSDATYLRLRRIVLCCRDIVNKLFPKKISFRPVPFLKSFMHARTLRRDFETVSHLREYTESLLSEKLQFIYRVATGPLFRCNFWAEIARLERIRKNDLFSIVYDLRILRLLGRDVFGVLDKTIAGLKANGFVYEAEVAQALYGDPELAEERAYAYLKAAEKRNRHPGKRPPFVVCEDRREGTPRVSVIVSMYDAGPKLRFFLKAILQQTLIRSEPHSVELVLVDSASPSNEGEVVKAFREEMPLNAVYARSNDRETIQTAWNRGIQLAHAPYLVFLGVDETLYPEALEHLVDHLDKNPDVDWAMGSSLVTEVDAHGIHVNDVMKYDRKGAQQDLCYLETCYVSWVGGMYRKSIHDRFGYYDESFRGAGDTEFKSRILPHIKVSFLPETLGLFLNYPEERTTASPMAEIEDSRAWYIHRTAAGVKSAFEDRPLEDVYGLMLKAVGYRKSYCGHISSDIEYAKLCADYLLDRQFDKEGLAEFAEDLGTMLNTLRSLELTPVLPSWLQNLTLLAQAVRSFRTYQNKHRLLFKERAQPVYAVRNDNRYEQHSWLWKTPG